jgi:hypothetical protein
VEVAVHLTTVANRIEADIICSMLRAEGIKCADRTADLGANPWLASGGSREILVAPADFEAARELLAARSL